MDDLIFFLNDTTYMQIMPTGLLHEIHCCSEVPLFFVHKNKKYPVGWANLASDLNGLRMLLHKALAGQLSLPDSINTDIGYLYNQSYYANHEIIWEGDNYLLWHNKYITWLYNDEYSNMIMEVTPMYLGYWRKCREPYDEWIKKYKPVFKGIIPPGVARQWIAQVERIMALIDANSERMKREWEQGQEKNKHLLRDK